MKIVAHWKCIRCGVLGLSIPRYDSRICAWCAKEVAKIGAEYCERCRKYHTGNDCFPRRAVPDYNIDSLGDEPWWLGETPGGGKPGYVFEARVSARRDRVRKPTKYPF